MNASHLTLIPVVTDKSYKLSKQRVYAFKVPKIANKQGIIAAVSAQFEVKVSDVRVVVTKGKVKRTIRKGTPQPGTRSDVKKAYVTLVEGDSIKIFDEEEQK